MNKKLTFEEFVGHETLACEHCKYNDTCDGHVKCYGHQPVFPPCEHIEVLQDCYDNYSHEYDCLKEEENKRCQKN